MLERIQKYRRDLHQIPELELELPKTQRYLQEALRDLPCTLSSPIPSSVVAFFDAGKKESIAFRSDMDALPVTEATGRAFASRHTGCMHACGHDGHMAMLLEFAHQLSAYYKELPHNVVLIFSRERKHRAERSRCAKAVSLNSIISNGFSVFMYGQCWARV